MNSGLTPDPRPYSVLKGGRAVRKSSYSEETNGCISSIGSGGVEIQFEDINIICQVYGHKLPKNAIKQAFLDIVGSGGSKWMDLGEIHPG